jgi:hypothetical protein
VKSSVIVPLLTLLACAGWLAGCMTPESRIRRHPEIIARLPPAQLELIRQGQVAPGFDMEMVRLALGEPDRVTMRETAVARTDAGTEVWGYATYESAQGQPLYRGFYHFYYLSGDPDYPFYANYPGRRVSGRFNVVFRGDRVIDVERDAPLVGRN